MTAVIAQRALLMLLALVSGLGQRLRLHTIAGQLLLTTLSLSKAAGQLCTYAGQWRESLLLNTHSLTEIVVLTPLLRRIISPALYVTRMLMGLISTQPSALAAAYPHAVTHKARSRYEIS